jgi:redox-sensitive bicupin YhaK (pirin superfamily)
MNESSSTPSAIETLILPRSGDIGGFAVERVLPSRQRRMVGPFVFLDQMGPAQFGIGEGLDVLPHPHIGLATLTDLLEGELLHRDSLGTRQTIRPGEVNWMIAGRGIAHSERSPEALRGSPQRLFGLQSWVALPGDREECEPDFEHHSAAALPTLEASGVRIDLRVGQLHGARSPVTNWHEALYARISLADGGDYLLEAMVEERALWLIDGAIEIDGEAHVPGRLLVLRPGARLRLRASAPAQLLLLGGAAMDGPRHIWWNFVSSRRERIEQAKADWQAGRFDRVIDELEALPLPGS